MKRHVTAELYNSFYYLSQTEGLMTCARISVLPYYLSQTGGLMTCARISVLLYYLSQTGGLSTCARISVLPYYLSQARGLTTYARISVLHYTLHRHICICKPDNLLQIFRCYLYLIANFSRTHIHLVKLLCTYVYRGSEELLHPDR